MSEPWIGEMDAADRTRALARAGWAVDRQYVCLAIEDAERRARARVLEEAAELALHYNFRLPRYDQSDHAEVSEDTAEQVCRQIAESIRGMMQP